MITADISSQIMSNRKEGWFKGDQRAGAPTRSGLYSVALTLPESNQMETKRERISSRVVPGEARAIVRMSHRIDWQTPKVNGGPDLFEKENGMKQCPQCPKFKKADNCIECGQYWERAKAILLSAMNDGRKIEELSKIVKESET